MNETPKIDHIRREYSKGGLTESEMAVHPIQQFKLWFENVLLVKPDDPTAMILATCGADGMPQARTVLLKDFDENGFVFYTNYESSKGKELMENPKATLLFYWDFFEQQVKINGVIEKVPREESEAYFKSRPYESQLGAWASDQSRPLESQRALIQRFKELKEMYEPGNVPYPEHWGGYCVKPQLVEFWQGRPGRLHDRIVYEKGENGEWTMKRLSP